ncbi:MAG: DUF333 domain-containing protein [Planctomycetota bacterium]|nr:MAG: DUF333 domain-containing protein [Planctomycetota bacterium]
MKPLGLFLSILLILPSVAVAIPNPAAVYCVEQGYDYEIRTRPDGGQYGVCIFPDGSECGEWQYYCKCEPNGIGCWQGDFNCAFPCQQLPCRQAGQFVSIGECCPQLAEIPRIEAYDDQCNLLGWLGWLFICSDCGDGICESWESICNCPQDCAPVHNITQDTYHETIQDAIDDANDGDTVIVSDGTYTGTGNRDIDFLGKAITVRSESGPENCIIDCKGTWQEPHRGFYFHNGEPDDAVLQGFTIINGDTLEGGAIYCRDGSPKITRCTIVGNSAALGGGIYCETSSPTITDCNISDNSARDGGAIYSFYSISLTITNCTISGGSANNGGGIYIRGGNSTVANCIISGNISHKTGIGPHGEGGGIFCWESEPTIINCTIAGNMASKGGGLNGCYGPISNCIIWDNSADNGPQLYNSTEPNYSCIQGWSNSGEANIDADPCFIDPGFWDANGTPQDANDDFWIEGDYHLLEGSPCIDTGDPNYSPGPNETDLDGNPRVTGCAVDMGAYEYPLPLVAQIHIQPRTINLRSQGKWLTCRISLPAGYNATDIDHDTILLEDEIEPASLRIHSGAPGAVAFFSRQDLQDILSPGRVELKITGQLTDGTEFMAADTIKVLNNPPPKPDGQQKPKVNRRPSRRTKISIG